MLVPGFRSVVCLLSGRRSRGGARGARVRTGSDRAGLCLLSCRWGWYCWSSGCRQGAEPLPAGEERVLPGPVRADLQDAFAGVAGEPGRSVQYAVASLNFETVMVRGEGDRGLAAWSHETQLDSKVKIPAGKDNLPLPLR